MRPRRASMRVASAYSQRLGDLQPDQAIAFLFLYYLKYIFS
jgi:hypothetical protein